MCVLVIDDEESSSSFIKEALECLGYRVFSATNPQHAIKFYEERWREIDVVLLDYWLPQRRATSSSRTCNESIQTCGSFC